MGLSAFNRAREIRAQLDRQRTVPNPEAPEHKITLPATELPKPQKQSDSKK